MKMQQGPMSQSGMTQQMQHQTMNRETVRSVQRRLNQLGYRAGPEDGIMGPRTRRAISAYQGQMGMQPDGKLTPDLVDRMMAGSKAQ
jgi:peptidoglycan hydrolase-like protein with peptidoglycan-binding domain